MYVSTCFYTKQGHTLLEGVYKRFTLGGGFILKITLLYNVRATGHFLFQDTGEGVVMAKQVNSRYKLVSLYYVFMSVLSKSAI
jgi:hypothetical protein